jgi:chromosome segregation ATPase
VRFADQTCVELSEKLKNEKSKAGRYQHDLGYAKEENNRLLKKHESITLENAKLKAMLHAQREQTSLQLEEYRDQIVNLEESHRSHLNDWESRLQSHLKNTENQIYALNERLAQSFAVNSTLQSKLDKWESKLTNDQSSQDIISALKERVESAESSASKADATIQAMQARIYDLQGLCDQQQNTIHRERN